VELDWLDCAIALTDYHFQNDLEFNKFMNEERFLKIVLHQIECYGKIGRYDTAYFDMNKDKVDGYSSLYQAASDWMKTNYPQMK
jgi:hypothetical protein